MDQNEFRQAYTRCRRQRSCESAHDTNNNTGRWLFRGQAEFARSSAVVLTAVEAQAVADTDTAALRALLLPRCDGVATSFAELLLRVVRRCKREGQVYGRILGACEALGLHEGRPVPASLLAKRLRGLGLAWHSFTLEECQAFAERELDGDGDGWVTVRDVFAFVHHAWTEQPRSNPRSRAARKSGANRRTLDDIHRGFSERRQTRPRVGPANPFAYAEKNSARLEEKLLEAARLARLRGVHVLEALNSGYHSAGHAQGVLGAEGTCHFLETIGIDFDSSSSMMTENDVDVVCRKGSGYTRPEELRHSWGGTQEHSTLKHDERQGRRALPLPRELFPPERAHSLAGRRCCGAPTQHVAETTPWLEPRSASSRHFQAGGARKQKGQTPQYERSCPPLRKVRDTNDPNPPESLAVARGVSSDEALPMGRSEDAGVCDEVGIAPTPYARETEQNAMLEKEEKLGRRDENACVSSVAPQVHSGASQRLRHAAAELKRMEAEYAALQHQLGDKTGGDGLDTPRAEEAVDTSDSEDGVCGDGKDARGRHNADDRSSSRLFYAGHDAPEPEESDSGKRPSSASLNREEYRRSRRDDHHQSCALGEDMENPGRVRGRARRRRSLGNTISGTKPGATANGALNRGERYQPPTCWPRYTPDTRRCRALLLMAAQGKSQPEETFDAPSAHNGFSGMLPCGLFGIEGCRIRAHRGRYRYPPGHQGAPRVGEGRQTHRQRPLSGGAEVVRDASSDSTPNLHHFLAASAGGERRRGGYGAKVGVSEGARRSRPRDTTPERRPARPKAIKSPMYARSRSEERNVWDARSGRWKKPALARGDSADKYKASARCTSTDGFRNFHGRLAQPGVIA